MPITNQLPRRTALCQALLLACLGSALCSPAVLAQSPQGAEVQQTRQYNISAGRLDQVLNQFAASAGILLAIDGSLTEGKSSQGLRGDYGIQDGLTTILTGTGLTMRLTGENSVTIELAGQSGVMMLSPVQIASTPLGSTTEGTGSYTTGDTNSSTGLDLTLRETPQSMTVMTHDRMKDQNLDEIQEVLEQAVGIENASTGGLGTDGTIYYSRGFQVENYLVDGMPRPTYFYGFREEVNDMIAYDRVEIVRGASGLMTGRGSPAASINLIRKQPTEVFQASITAKAGSWDLYRLEADISGSLSDENNLRGRLVVSSEDKDSFVDRVNTERQALYGVLEKDFGDSTTLSMGLEYQDFQNDGAPRGGLPLFYSDGTETNFSDATNNATDWSSFQRDSTNVFILATHSFSENWSLKLNAEHKDASYDETIGYVWARQIEKDTGQGGSLLIARWTGDVEIDAISANLQGKFDLFNRQHDVTFTVTNQEYKSEGPKTPGWYSGSDYWVSGINAYDIYATGEWPKPDLGPTGGHSGEDAEQKAASGVIRFRVLDTLAVIAGARVIDWKQNSWDKTASGEKSTTRGANESGVVTPYLGVIYDLSKHLSAYASYTSIFEPQTEVDINANILDPLEGNSYEVGLKAGFLNGRLNASVAAYEIQQDNLGVADGVGIFASNGALAYHEEDGTQSRGFELEVSGQLLPGWQVAGGFARAKAEDDKGEQLNAYVPEKSFKLFSSYQLSGRLEGLTLGGNLRWQDKTVAEGAGPNGEDYVQDSFVLVDVMAKYTFPQNVTVALNVHNIFDKEYYKLYRTYGSYGAPRHFNLSLTYDF